MTDEYGRLERELASMQPRKLSPQLVGAIGDELAAAAKLSRSDRFLLAAMSAGALAACVIVSLLVAESASTRPAGTTLVVQAQSRPTDNPAAFARADLRWGDLLKQNLREKS